MGYSLVGYHPASITVGSERDFGHDNRRLRGKPTMNDKDDLRPLRTFLRE